MATHDATALVLGGAGSVGAETVRQLARRGRFQRLLVADRDLEAAQRLAQALGAEAVEIDVTNRPALVSLMRQAQVVLNAAGPFVRYGVPVVRAAIEAQVDYADVSDDVEPIQELFHTGAIDREARAAGITVVVGLGTSPGLTNIIARYGAQHLDTVTSVHFALCTGTWTRGAAVWAHRLHVNSGFATVYRDGRWTEVPAMSEEEIVTFPWPPGRASVHIVAHPEPLTLPRHLPGVREVVTKLGYPDAINRLLRDLSQYGLTSEESVALGDIQVAPRVFLAAYLASPQADRRFGLSALTPYSAPQVTLTGTRDGREVTLRYQLAMSGGPPETALPLVIAGEMLAAGQIAASGLLAPEALDPLPFLQALPSLGVKARLIREEASSGVISQEGVAGA
jgi:saccharopine dehydrogenase (NAD+, L-lysine-forming)